ncbi:MAG TPA: hypothetical protein VMU48_03940 [Terracidiphilus sp.]|nr:hypothetical protein [Terracidiphilus sp.]
MQRNAWAALGMVVIYSAFCVPPVSAQRLEATVLYRQSSETVYRALVPGYSDTGAVDCAADVTNQACTGPSTSLQANSDARELRLNVAGTTVSLMLPDGRIAVLNCADKFSSRSTYSDRRSCAMPLVEHVEAYFDGQRAKLKWPVGPDGKKTESETYKIVALLARR